MVFKQLLTVFIVLFFGTEGLKAQILEIPFQLKNDIILIELQINDHTGSHTFVFDTGASYDVLDVEVAKSLGLKPDFKQEARGAGGTSTVDIVLDQKFVLGKGVSVASPNLVLVDLRKLRRKLEKNFDGIIGYSVLAKYITQIDYDQKKIRLFERIQDVNTAGYTRIPFQLSGGIPIPQFDIAMTLRNNETYKGPVFLDSGAALTLAVNTPYNKKHRLDEKAGKSILSETQNLNSTSISENIAIQSMTIGDYTLGEMVISLANDQDGVSSYKGYLGILGARVISRFNLVLDYAASHLYLKPNGNFSKAFEFPVSGITLIQESGSILISRVQEVSPAYQNGVREGDRLISINSTPAGDIETCRQLLKEEGKVCRLVLEDREGQRKEVTIKLERLL